MSEELKRLEERIKTITVDQPADDRSQLNVATWGLAVALQALPRLKGEKEFQREHLTKAATNIDRLAEVFGQNDERVRLLRRIHKLAKKECGLSRCFVATAACGSEDAADVVCLREFRDTVLAHTALGRWAVRLYECWSPPVAHRIERSLTLRRLVRGLVVKPAARAARRLFRTGFDR